MKKDIPLKIEITKFQSEIMGLSNEQLGAYMRLLFFDFEKEGFPANPSAASKICGLSENEFSELWQMVGKNFNMIGGGLFCHLENTRQKNRELVKRNILKKNGNKGVIARKQLVPVENLTEEEKITKWLTKWSTKCTTKWLTKWSTICITNCLYIIYIYNIYIESEENPLEAFSINESNANGYAFAKNDLGSNFNLETLEKSLYHCILMILPDQVNEVKSEFQYKGDFHQKVKEFAYWYMSKDSNWGLKTNQEIIDQLRAYISRSFNFNKNSYKPQDNPVQFVIS